MHRSTFRFLPIAVLALIGLAPTAHAQQVYFNDFTAGAGPEWSNSTTATSNAETFLGASAFGFGNGTDTLTLTGLASHSAVTLDFDLYIINSWDGNGPNGGGLDSYRVDANSNNLLLTSFANFTGGNTQSYSAATPNGLNFNNAPRAGQFDAGHLGFGTGDFGDATYRFSYTFADVSSALAVNFTSLQNQALGDEGWGLDNVRVTLTPSVSGVPEPGSLALFAGMGVTGLLALHRRRK